MRFSLSIVVAAFATLVFAADPLVMNTPASLVQCSETTVTWQGGLRSHWRNYDGTFVKATGINERSRDWFVDLPAGDAVQWVVEDSTGAKSPSATIVVQPSTETGCL
ncbi:hypothetical protein C8Q79DRAFT_1006026 [Trametes meyenii]|nr:hypothetical protein C8Q79DRAFT_1006026 [Trametes meyenii]